MIFTTVVLLMLILTSHFQVATSSKKKLTIANFPLLDETFHSIPQTDGNIDCGDIAFTLVSSNSSLFISGNCRFVIVEFSIIKHAHQLSDYSLDHLRIESLFQDATVRYSIDESLQILQQYSSLVLYSNLHVVDSFEPLLMNLINILPEVSPFPTNVFIFDCETIDCIFRTMDVSVERIQSLQHSAMESGSWGSENHLFVDQTGLEYEFRVHRRAPKEIPLTEPVGLLEFPSVLDSATTNYIRHTARQASIEWINKVYESHSDRSLECFRCMNESRSISFDDKAVLKSIRDSFPSLNFAQHAKIRILCLTFTVGPYHDAIKNIVDTWGKRCDGYLAFSNVTDESLSILEIRPYDSDWKESYHSMWLKTQLIWKLVATTLLDEYDYFLLGGDDLYVIVENLRRALGSPELQRHSQNGTVPLYLGRVIQQNSYLQFQSGGAGYVLNAAAVARLYRTMFTPACLPGISTSMEDLMVGHCLFQSGVRPLALLDSEGRHIFHPVSPASAFRADRDWYTRLVQDYETGPRCCSPASCSFQDIRLPAYDMRLLHSFLYCDTECLDIEFSETEF